MKKRAKFERYMCKDGFTLIELLIVVLIIAILAAIAVPNFLEFQTRAKVSRVMSDMRALAVPLEAYMVDNGDPPLGENSWQAFSGSNPPPTPPAGWETQAWYSFIGLSYLTTPIQYITTIPQDPFNLEQAPGELQSIFGYNDYRYSGLGPFVSAPYDEFQYYWSLQSWGPSREQFNDSTFIVRLLRGITTNPPAVYDPTNGTVSIGVIVRTNKGFFDGRAGS